MPPPAPAPSAASTTPATSGTPVEGHSSYTILNSPSSSEQDIEAEIERIATGLFSVVATMGMILLASVQNISHMLSRTCPYYSLPPEQCGGDDCEET